MIAIDTNVLLRLVLWDHAKQREAGFRLMTDIMAAGETIFVSLVTLVEFVWVLKTGYGVGKAEIAEAVAKLLNASTIVVEQEDAVRRALESPHGDLSDRIIHFVGAAAGCERTVTFDRKFARLSGVELLEAAK